MASELGRPLPVDEVRPVAAEAFAEVFGVTFADQPAPTLR
jgi:hypothetical protein